MIPLCHIQHLLLRQRRRCLFTSCHYSVQEEGVLRGNTLFCRFLEASCCQTNPSQIFKSSATCFDCWLFYAGEKGSRRPLNCTVTFLRFTNRVRKDEISCSSVAAVPGARSWGNYSAILKLKPLNYVESFVDEVTLVVTPKETYCLFNAAWLSVVKLLVFQLVVIFS